MSFLFVLSPSTPHPPLPAIERSGGEARGFRQRALAPHQRWEWSGAGINMATSPRCRDKGPVNQQPVHTDEELPSATSSTLCMPCSEERDERGGVVGEITAVNMIKNGEYYFECHSE